MTDTATEQALLQTCVNECCELIRAYSVEAKGRPAAARMAELLDMVTAFMVFDMLAQGLDPERVVEAHAEHVLRIVERMAELVVEGNVLKGETP